MGKVYSARVAEKAPGVEVGSCVALKVVHSHLLETQGFFKRFMREADIGRTVEHGNVVRTFDCDQLIVDGTHYNFLVMEYVEGQTLRDLQEELERVPEELCRHIAQEVTQGLAAIHAANVIHRDIKPDNVLITPDHEIKVMDLGIARLQDEALRISMTGHFVGSMKYAAPEQFTDSDNAVGVATDLHALGVLLYEIASGRCPYAGDDMKQLIHQITSVEPMRLGDLNPQLSPFFEELVHTLLAKKPGDRFASAEALLEVLAAGTESEWWRERERTIRARTAQPLRRIRIPRDTAVYGRDEELAQLRKLYDRCHAGEGQVLLVEGEAGIGKSRLVDEFVGQLRQAGEDINFLFGSYPPGGAATSLGAFSTAYREHVGSNGSAELLPATPLLVPAFDALLRGDYAPTDCVPLTKDSVQTCFVHATRELAARRTTIVLIDDLHFAPEDGQALFASLALAVQSHRVLLIGTLRRGQVSEEWLAGVQRLDHVSRIILQRLGPRDLVMLLGDTFRSKRLAEELGAKIALKSDGNPFFVFEILRGMREGQFIKQEADGSWVSTRIIEEIQIPSTVLDLVGARVADLTEDERDLIDVASCCGFEFDPGLVGEVLGIARIPLLKRFGKIERTHRLVRSSGRLYVFDHHQVQEALYSSLHEQMREEYHSAVAETLESRTSAPEQEPDTLDGALCVDLCEHFLKGKRGEKALRYLAAAQRHLTRGSQYAQAVAIGERALAVTNLLTGAARAEVLVSLTDPLDILGRRPRQEEVALEAERLSEEAGDDELLGLATNALGMALLRSSRWAEAEASFRRALELARKLGNETVEAGVTVNLGNVFHAQGRSREARGYYERGLAMSREAGARLYEARATVNLGGVYHAEGRIPEARDYTERALALFNELGDRRGEASSVTNLGHLFQSEGRLDEAREYLERGLALNRETGERQFEAVAMGGLGLVYRREGRLSKARELHEQLLRFSREIGDRYAGAVAQVNLGEIWSLLGERERAREALEACLTVCREFGFRYPEGYALFHQGRLANDDDDSAEALRLTEECLALRREIKHPEGIVESLTQLGEIHCRAGDLDAASTALNEAATASRDTGSARHLALAESMLACLPGGDTEAAALASSEIRDTDDTPQLRWLLHRASGERVYLEQAKRLLDEQLAKVPEEYHESMCANVRVNREILAAWSELDALE